MYQLVFFVPGDHAEAVKEALFRLGAGQYHKYRRCSWQTAGEGQFEPGQDSQPFIGAPGQLETVKEFRVEMICKDEILRAVLDELARVHPYEEVAYYAVKIER
jgi:hypothetical protein